jgi:hypothetical protein
MTDPDKFSLNDEGSMKTQQKKRSRYKHRICVSAQLFQDLEMMGIKDTTAFIWLS